MPLLIALAGRSRSGKGTTAAVAHEVAAAQGLTSRERQLSGPGKQYVASAWRPDITEEEAVAWFDELKTSNYPVAITIDSLKNSDRDEHGEPLIEDRLIKVDVSLQQYLQRMLQGARDRWDEDFWTDKLLPAGRSLGNVKSDFNWPKWVSSFLVGDERRVPADVAIISDLRQENEARRVQDLGGVVIELVRPDVNDPYVTGRDHVTERGLPSDLVDFTIINDKGLEELRAEARDILEGIIYKGA